MSSASAIPSTQIHQEDLIPAITAFTYNLASALTKVEKISVIDVSSAEPAKDNQHAVSSAGPVIYNQQSVLKRIFEQIKLFIAQIKHAWNTTKSFIFDKIIETLINFAHQRKNNPPFNFGSIYSFFRLFGLEEIPHQTIKRLSGALQWKIISTNWINYDFFIGYEKRLFLKTSSEQSKSLKKLFEIYITMKKEEGEEKQFYQELNKIIDDDW